MNYPLKWYHEMARELTCCVAGHSWKISPSRKTIYYDLDPQEVPYSYRKSTGNYMWEDVASWKAKCTCCRIRTYEYPSNVWHVQLMQAFRAFWKSAFFILKDVFIERDVRLWRKVVVGIPLAITYGMYQGYGQFDGVVSFPLTILSNIESRLYEKLTG